MIARVQERFKVQGFVLTGQGGARHPGDRRRVRRESGGHRELDGTRVLRESAKHWPSIKQKQSAPKPGFFFGESHGEPKHGSGFAQKLPASCEQRLQVMMLRTPRARSRTVRSPQKLRLRLGD